MGELKTIKKARLDIKNKLKKEKKNRPAIAALTITNFPFIVETLL